MTTVKISGATAPAPDDEDEAEENLIFPTEENEDDE